MVRDEACSVFGKKVYVHEESLSIEYRDVLFGIERKTFRFIDSDLFLYNSFDFGTGTENARKWFIK